MDDLDAREAQILGKPQRIASLGNDEFDAEATALISNLRATLGLTTNSQIPAVFGLMLKHPGLFRCQMTMGAQLFQGAIPPRERELAVMRVGWLCRAPFEWGEHVTQSKRLGIGAEEIERVIQGPAAPGWSAHEAAILRGVDELLQDQMISDDTWNTLARTWSERQLIEFPTLIGQYVATAYSQNSLRVRLADGSKGLRER
ncbi:MAG TPA: carboxymuconolactone decarboxylase family protein [Steroidobacteraceae bacterium]|jgi:alkylhydroperoxidase family enzyme|nr:carboxymuconolactone decarboxylase family protein [Steroidobacteraceae bacterium]